MNHFASPFNHKRRAALRAALACAIAIAAGSPPGTAQANDLKLGRLAPPLVLHTVDGRTIATRDLIGKIVIVTFWASWCGPCREELPILSEYAARHEHQGLRVLGFSIDGPEDLEEVRKVATTLSFPVGLLGGPWAGGYGRIWRMPVSFVLDREGKLIDNGWDDKEPAWTVERLHRVMDPLLLKD